MGSVGDTTAVPNPGSDEALDQGCLCPVIDNHHGQGFPYPDGKGGYETAFYYIEWCPLHKIEMPDDT